MAKRKKSSGRPQRKHKKKLQSSRHDKRHRLDLRNPLRRITSRAIVPLVGALCVAVLMKTSTEYWKTCCAAESNVRLWRRKRKYERTLKRLWTSIDTISEETHHKDTKALRMQRGNEVLAKAPRRKGRSESQGILPYFAPLRLCERSLLCLSLWPIMSVLLSSVCFCGEIHFIL